MIEMQKFTAFCHLQLFIYLKKTLSLNCMNCVVMLHGHCVLHAAVYVTALGTPHPLQDTW